MLTSFPFACLLVPQILVPQISQTTRTEILIAKDAVAHLPAKLILGRGKGIDQIHALRASPAGDEVISRNSGIAAITSLGDVVEVGGETRSQPDRIELRIDKSDGCFSVGGCLLIRHRNQAGP